MVDPVPPGLEDRLIPYLLIDGAARAIDFYKQAFDAEEQYRLEMPDGAIGHAEIRVGGAPIYLADAPTDMPGSSGSPAKTGDAAPIGWIAEQTSCRKPGSVSSAVRAPPPIASRASTRSTDRPAAARTTAAASPLGPAPTTMASRERLKAGES